MTDKKTEFRAHVFETWTSKLGRCLAPGDACENLPINAHSIQRSGPLSLLAEDGHVYVLASTLDPAKRPRATFTRVGINKATVFSGLCPQHDAVLFRPIEARSFFDPDNLAQQRLYAYRAVLQETHAALESAVRLQLSYQKACDLGMISREAPTPSGLFATERLIASYETWLYKQGWDRVVEGAPGCHSEHDLLYIGNFQPRLAVSALFSFDEVRAGDDVARAAITLLPTMKGTYVLFGYLPHEAELARAELATVFASSGPTQRYLLSRLILERCANIAFSPRTVASMGQEQRDTITRFFDATVLRNDNDFHSPHLNLFDTAA